MYYAEGNETQKIVTGYIIITNGSVIDWCQLSHKTATLFVTEAKYSAIMEVCCKILFSVKFYGLWDLLSNKPSPFTLIIL